MEFEHGSPFPSLAQLLSVLPPQSSDLLPKALAELMLHPASPIFPYYPPDFTVDPNGKRQSWEAIVQIPFIEADLLLDTVQKIIDADSAGKDLLTNAERRRNAKGQSHVFVPPGGGKRDEVDVSRGTMPPRTKNNRKTAAIGKRTIASSQKG
jgi:5'-3' exoribonuclease 1